MCDYQRTKCRDSNLSVVHRGRCKGKGLQGDSSLDIGMRSALWWNMQHQVYKWQLAVGSLRAYVVLLCIRLQCLGFVSFFLCSLNSCSHACKWMHFLTLTYVIFFFFLHKCFILPLMETVFQTANLNYSNFL